MKFILNQKYPLLIIDPFLSHQFKSFFFLSLECKHANVGTFVLLSCISDPNHTKENNYLLSDQIKIKRN